MQSTTFVNKLQKVRDQVSTARDEWVELRQEASDLQEYSTAKIHRVTRYLGVLADKARRLDQVALDSEARVTPLRKQKKRLFNDLLAVKGNVRVFCRVRPQFEDEGPVVTAFPDDFTLRINQSMAAAPVKEFEFDHVYGPHVSQGDFFQDLQPLVQSALDGYNVSIFSYGQTGSGKTHTMEGPTHDRGVYFRAFEELFDLANAEAMPTSRCLFYVTMFELHNDQVWDLLRMTEHMKNNGTVLLGETSQSADLVEEKVASPSDFSSVFRLGSQMRATLNGRERASRSHLVVTIHIHYANTLSGEEQYSKLSMVDMAGSERLTKEEANGNRLTESLHINRSLSALGDVFSALTAKKEHVPHGNSKLTQLLADSLGGDSKALLIVNICPSLPDLQETLSSLNFASRARNVELSLGNRDTIKKWRDMANDARKEAYEKEKESNEAYEEVMRLNQALQQADDQCLLLFGEVQKAWKSAASLQSDLTDHEAQITKLQLQNTRLSEQRKVDKNQSMQLKTQLAQFIDQEDKHQSQLQERAARIEALEVRVQMLEQQLADAQEAATRARPMRPDDAELQKGREEIENALAMNQKLEEELSKRDELIERLHQENEKLFERLTERRMSASSPRVSASPKFLHGDSRQGVDEFDLDSSSFRSGSGVPASPDRHGSSSMKAVSLSVPPATPGTVALMKSGTGETLKSTPAGEYLTAALMDFNPDQYDGPAAVADGANKLLMLVLAAVIKAGAAREHEMLAEIQGAVLSFIRRMEPRRVMDTMLVSRVRILYIRSLLSRSPELQNLKVPPVERFLERAVTNREHKSRDSSRGSSPVRSPMSLQSNFSRDGDNSSHGFRVKLRHEKQSKFSSIVQKLRGIDQSAWRQHVMGGKLRETNDEARTFAIGNKSLASLFVHTPAGELQRQIRGWLAENFDFLSLTGGESIGGVTGHLELLSTAILDGWMSGLGVAQRPSTDALGQLLSDYTKLVYTRQLQHLKDVAATLATEEAEDASQMTKLRSALESVEHKRRKVLQQMKTDEALLTKDEGGSPPSNPSTATEDTRVASLISLEDIYKQAEEIQREVSAKAVNATKKKSLLMRLDSLVDHMSTLLPIDHHCAEKFIAEARKVVESTQEQQEGSRHSRIGTMDDISNPAEVCRDWEDGSNAEAGEVVQWSVLQFNNGSATPFVIKCGATSSSELVVKAQAKMQDKNGQEIVAVVPMPSILAGLSVEEIRQTICHLPESFCQLAMARTADGTRARYTRLYKTLAVRVPALRDVVNELDEKSKEPRRP